MGHSRKYRVVHAPRVAVRSSPNGAIVGSKPAGEEFLVVEEAGGWVKLTHGGRDAWMLVDGSSLGLGLLLSKLPQLDPPVVVRTFSLALAVQLPAGERALHLRVQDSDGEQGARVLGPFEPIVGHRPVDVRGLRPSQCVRLRAESADGAELLASTWVEATTSSRRPGVMGVDVMGVRRGVCEARPGRSVCACPGFQWEPPRDGRSVLNLGPDEWRCEACGCEAERHTPEPTAPEPFPSSSSSVPRPGMYFQTEADAQAEAQREEAVAEAEVEAEAEAARDAIVERFEARQAPQLWRRLQPVRRVWAGAHCCVTSDTLPLATCSE